MRRRREPDRIEFNASNTSEVAARLDAILQSAQGWVNLDPEVESERLLAVTPSVVGGWFRSTGAPVPQITVTAPRVGRSKRKPAQLGISHGVGTPVLARLAAEGLDLPEAWKVVQDHLRRGVVIDVPADAHGPEIVSWALQAGALLCPIPTTGNWLAKLHQGG